MLLSGKALHSEMDRAMGAEQAGKAASGPNTSLHPGSEKNITQMPKNILHLSQYQGWGREHGSLVTRSRLSTAMEPRPVTPLVLQEPG